MKTPEGDDDLLTPREVAEIFGVRTTTVARWSREGRLNPMRTPGGHRRFTRSQVRKLKEEEEAAETGEFGQWFAEDAVRLYDQGWSIRQVAARFDCGYGAMRRLLLRRTALRSRNGRFPSGGDGRPAE